MPTNTTPSNNDEDDLDKRESRYSDNDFSNPHGDEHDPSYRNPAADLIRRKLDALYAEEPNFKEEIKEVEQEEAPVQQKTPVKHSHTLSKHQEFMYKLTESGKSLAEIQTQWHNYYINLPDDEKGQVWEEFYEAGGHTPQFFHRVANQVRAAQQQPEQTHETLLGRRKKRPAFSSSKVIVAEHSLTPPKKTNRQILNIARDEVVRRVSADGRLKAKHHLQSLAFGLGIGLLAVVVFLFGFFNQVIIAPFIQPSRHTTATPIILSSATAAASSTPEVIIPKINVEIPVDYSETTTDESVIENALESGVVHFPSTVFPGQLGNAAFFGHSSNNIFNPGKYKFAFVLLHTLVPGDTFYLVYNGVNYVYQVYATKIVPPSDVSVLDNVPGKTATAALITCDPPGTSINRLVVWGQQVSPDPTGNAQAAPVAATTASAPTALPGNGPSLWSRFIHFVF